jgi:ArsR family transcriptional regulator
MVMKQNSEYRLQADLLRAMAHPMRLAILDILSQTGECCVCHMTAILKRRQPYVSQHLMVLRSKGLVTDRKDGTLVYYRLADERVGDLVVLTRQVVEASSGEVHLRDVPRPPVRGCPCPACTAAFP